MSIAPSATPEAPALRPPIFYTRTPPPTWPQHSQSCDESDLGHRSHRRWLPLSINSSAKFTRCDNPYTQPASHPFVGRKSLWPIHPSDIAIPCRIVEDASHSH